jgi:hypothetical protein
MLMGSDEMSVGKKAPWLAPQPAKPPLVATQAGVAGTQRRAEASQILAPGESWMNELVWRETIPVTALVWSLSLDQTMESLSGRVDV